MFQNLIENLRNLPREHKTSFAFFATLLAAVVVVPLWFWNASRVGFVQKSANAEPAEGQNEKIIDFNEVSQAFGQIKNPITQVDKKIRESLSQPVGITSVKTDNENLRVEFKVANNTLADLILPTSRISLVGSSSVLQKVETPDGDQFAPVIRASQSRDGVLVFDKLKNGNYQVKFSGLRYDDENQTEFDQIISIEVFDAYLPRS